MAMFRRMGNLFRRSRMDDEIDAELKSHIEMRIEENLAGGMSAEEARHDALVRFGNQTVTRERVAAEDMTQAFSGLWRNVRYAVRQLRRSPGFAVTAILTLALGIGPNVAIFSIVWATFLAPIPYPHADQLVVVWSHHKGEREPVRGEDYAQYAAQCRSFQRFDFESWRALHLTNDDHTQDETSGLPESPGMNTETLGLKLALGRDFLPDEGGPGKDHLVLITHYLWTHRYHADRDILGKFILIEDEPYQVVGVIAATPKDGPGFFVPLLLPIGNHQQQFGNVFGRLKPGVTLTQAQAEIAVIDQRLASQRNGGKDSGSSVSVEHLRNDWLDHKIERNLWLLLSAVGSVLLIACANIANLLLARGASRRQELAVRSAVGATRRQIFGQLLTESLTLALLGGAFGIVMGWGIMKLSLAIFPNQLNQSSENVVEMNVPVLCFAVGVTLIAGVLFGCAPGWQALRLNLCEILKQGSRAVGGRSHSAIQSILVTVEVALALVLLAGAGMALHSFWNLRHIDLGFNVDRVVTADLRSPVKSPQGGKPKLLPPEQIVVQQHQIIDRLRAVPGIADAALTTGIPLSGYDNFPFSIAGQPTDKNHPSVADFEGVTPSFFNTFRIGLAHGRFLSDNDTLGTPPVIMVNETFVKRYLQNVDPLNQRLVLPNFHPGNPDKKQFVEYQIVGVFHDVLDNEHLTGKVQPEMYVSLWQAGWSFVSFAVRTAVDPEAVMGGLRNAVSSAVPGTTITKLETMQEILDDQRSSDRFGMVLFAGFAAIALLLAAVGIYGIMAFAVSQRTHEIGIRMALGARQREVVTLMVRDGMRLALIGIVIGLAGAYGLGRLMQTTLYGVGAVDFGSLTVVSALLLLVAALACWLPARRSAAIDPMQALRNE
jgi:putative ABC transport system permease protein